jgi:hypothetical protein
MIKYRLKTKQDLVALVLVARPEPQPVKRKPNGKLVHDCLLLLQIKKPVVNGLNKQ